MCSEMLASLFSVLSSFIYYYVAASVVAGCRSSETTTSLTSLGVVFQTNRQRRPVCQTQLSANAVFSLDSIPQHYYNNNSPLMTSPW